MSFTGRQLVQIIKLAGLENNTRSEIVEMFAERGFTVPPGSAGRALSRARGSWSSDQIFGESDGIFYERGAKVNYLPLSTETYITPEGELIGGGDVLSDWEGKVGIPLADAFFLAQQGGIEWSARTRGAIERSLKYIYENYGLSGQDALDDLGNRVNTMADQIEDTLLYEVSILQVGGFNIDSAISQVYSL
jgi:hypothetical protein